MPKIFTPSNQLKLSNVQIVRMKKNGKRYEIACYKDKVMAWRNKTETDIDEVLHTNTVFTNVSKGLVANKDELIGAFEKNSLTEICKEILNKGEIQVTDKERHNQLDKVVMDIATIISDNCINLDSKQPYSVDDINQAMKDLHFIAKPNRSSKIQAQELIGQLKDKIPIRQAKIRVEIQFTMKDWKMLKQKIVKLCTDIDEDKFEGRTVTLIAWIFPKYFKIIEDLLKSSTKGTGAIKILDIKEIEDDLPE